MAGPPRVKRAPATSGGANLGFEAKLWQAADKLRGQMDAAEYKHVVLGLVFLKYVSDAFEERHQAIAKESQADPEDRDEYTAENVFWVPKQARWPHLQANAKQPTVGKVVDDAMEAIERENSSLKGVLPKDYARPSLDKQRLGELIDLVGTIGLGDKLNRSRDILGRVYEYFLGQFASAEGKKGGEFYTPRCVVRLLVQMLEPYKGRVYDPCCGSSGMFVQSEEFIKEHGGKLGDISIFGQESNPTTWRLSKMNLAIRGIEANLGPENADAFHRDLHKDLKADFVLANPPFNLKDWGGERLRNDVRWKFGPPRGNANYAWIQHIIHHLAPGGTSGFVLANGSLSSNQNDEGKIRKKIIEADLIDCVISLPPQLFYGAAVPACLWFLSRDKKGGRFRDRSHEILFIDARRMGRLVDKVHRELTESEISSIAECYHSWRTENKSAFSDKPGFCKAATIHDVEAHAYVLSPGQYVGAPAKDFGVHGIEWVKNAESDLKQVLDSLASLAGGALLSLQVIENALDVSSAKGDQAQLRPGWKVTKLGEHVDLLVGFPFQSRHYSSDGESIRLLRGDNIAHDSLHWEDAKRWPIGLMADLEKYPLRKNDVVVAMDGMIVGGRLRFARVSDEDLPCLLVQRVARLRTRNTLDQSFLYYLVASQAFLDHVWAVQTGTTISHISSTQIAAFQFLLPPLEDQKRIGQVTKNFTLLLDFNRRTNRALVEVSESVFRAWYDGDLTFPKD